VLYCYAEFHVFDVMLSVFLLNVVAPTQPFNFFNQYEFKEFQEKIKLLKGKFKTHAVNLENVMVI
jgi:hypothetical protein